MEKHPDKIIFFDGVCNFCNSSIDRIFRYNKKKNLKYASLQSDFAKKFLGDRNIDTQNLDTIIYYADDRFYFRSTAILKVAKELSGGWRLLPALFVFPRVIRDIVYDWIAKNRYKWFGKKETCRIPTKEEQNYFIN